MLKSCLGGLLRLPRCYHWPSELLLPTPPTPIRFLFSSCYLRDESTPRRFSGEMLRNPSFNWDGNKGVRGGQGYEGVSLAGKEVFRAFCESLLHLELSPCKIRAEPVHSSSFKLLIQDDFYCPELRAPYAAAPAAPGLRRQIGRASCRERV